jgi:hypothetical protein
MYKLKNHSLDKKFIVNVISFSGHEITYDGDTIGVIPELEEND